MNIIYNFDDKTTTEERSAVAQWLQDKYPNYVFLHTSKRLTSSNLPPTTFTIMCIQAEAFLAGFRACY